MTKVFDYIVIINSMTILMNLFDLIYGEINGWNIVALLLCCVALGGTLIQERLKLQEIETDLEAING